MAWVRTNPTSVDANSTAETTALLENFRAAMHHSPAAALAALYAYESRVPAIAKTKAEGLAAHYEADATTRRYFTVHTTADVEHAQVWHDALTAELAAHPEQAEAALASGEEAARPFGQHSMA